MEKNIRLGRGLSALLGDDDTDEVMPAPKSSLFPTKDTDIIQADIRLLLPSPFQPRRLFNSEGLADLVASIQEKGVLQPLIVRKKPYTNNFEIIAGERRFRASKVAGLKTVPVIVKDFSDKDALEVAIIENLQRENLNPLEEAEAYKRLLQEYKYTHEELSKVMGKSRSHLSNMIRLLDLPIEVKEMVDASQLSVGHARALLVAKDPIALAQEVVKKGHSVRQVEKLASKKESDYIKQKSTPAPKDAHLAALEQQISKLLNTKLTINWGGTTGKIVIEYDSLEKLDLILKRISADGPLEL